MLSDDESLSRFLWDLLAMTDVICRVSIIWKLTNYLIQRSANKLSNMLSQNFSNTAAA